MLVSMINYLIVTIEAFGTTLWSILEILENFNHKFANLVAPPADGTTKCLVCCKGLPVL